MDTRSNSRSSSPSLFAQSSRSTSTSDVTNTPESIGTPGTDTSILFDHVTVEPLDISDASYILVVGGLGYIGSHTTLELLKEGHNVAVVDDLSNAFRDVLDRIQLLIDEHCQANDKVVPDLKFHEADYKSPVMRSILSAYASKNSGSPLSNLSRPPSRIKGVIHFAAFKSVEESINNPIPYYLNNVCGMVSFLSLLQEFGIMNFVFSSSATVYGSKANEGYPLREEHCVHEEELYTDDQGVQQRAEPGVSGLTSPYGKTKWICETILADVAKSDPRWTITALRYFNPVGCHESGLLGEDPRQTPTNLVPIVVRVLTGANPTLKIFGTDYNTADGTAIRDFIHVVDLARGHIAALSAAAEGRVKETFRTYNLGTGTGHSVREIVKSIEKASSRAVPVQEVGRRPGDVGSCVAGIGRASSELGWASVKTLDDCTADVWNFTAKTQFTAPATSVCQAEACKMACEELVEEMVIA